MSIASWTGCQPRGPRMRAAFSRRAELVRGRDPPFSRGWRCSQASRGPRVPVVSQSFHVCHRARGNGEDKVMMFLSQHLNALSGPLKRHASEQGQALAGSRNSSATSLPSNQGSAWSPPPKRRFPCLMVGGWGGALIGPLKPHVGPLKPTTS